MEVVSESKVSFRDIFVSKAWSDFYKKNKGRIRHAVIDSIEKILLCGSGELGYGVLRCKCGHEEFVHFTCKCRFCSKCGKMACDNWMKKVIGWALPNIKYKHVVFTIPQELRIFLMVNRKDGLDSLFKASTDSLLYVFENCFKCKPGIITVMHTFGGDVKWNPHIHVIITQGGLSLDGKKWSNHSTIPEAFIKASWKRNVVTALRGLAKKVFCNDWKQYNAFNSVLNALYKKTWYVNLGRTLKSLEFTVHYIGRYAKRPVLAETRLESFDGENVSFSFKDKLTKKITITPGQLRNLSDG